jgi:hypothetical protein
MTLIYQLPSACPAHVVLYDGGIPEAAVDLGRDFIRNRNQEHKP